MSYADQLNIKMLTADDGFIANTRATLEFPYDEEFIAALKGHVPARDRAYDPDTHIWTVYEPQKYLPRIIASAERRFSHIIKEFRRGQDLIFLNVRTGAESVQKGLF